ncbi:MAG: lytic transglycosylase domain-containing protein [Pseudomonadota bacterium]
MIRTILTAIVLTSLTPAIAAPPQEVLSTTDAALYREIFDLQERGAWAAADKKIKAVRDDVLMGYVDFQRYMHPTKYRAKYSELKRWMAYYADHPEAARVHRLAVRRRPKSDRGPKRPAPRQWRDDRETHLHPDLAADYKKTGRGRLNRIEGRVRYLARRERAAQAHKEIDRHLKNGKITVRQYDRMRSWIAASYYYQGYVDAAARISGQVAKRNGDTAVLSYWIAGLAAFRKGDLAASHDYFDAMARVPHQEDDLRAGAGYWAARTALADGAPEAVTRNLEIAAAHPFTFYGQLALAQLGRDADFDWTAPSLTKESFARLAADRPAVRRAAALVQTGRIAEAELEMRWLNGAIPSELDRDLLALAAALNLPAAQMEIALSGDAAYLQAGLFPIPDYTPKSGFEADRALIYALMRQESKFKLDAKSRAGARGLMQLMPRTASYVAGDRNLRRTNGRNRLFDPALNLDLGQKYVNQLIDRHTDGDLFKVAVAYNGGPGNLRRWDRKLDIDDPLLFIESIPNSESRDYVEKVLTNVWVYRARLGQPAPTRDKVAAGALPVYEALDALSR